MAKKFGSVKDTLGTSKANTAAELEKEHKEQESPDVIEDIQKTKEAPSASDNASASGELNEDIPVKTTDNNNETPTSSILKDEGKPKKHAGGRPKTRDAECKTINIAIPLDTLERINEVKALYKNNLTHYINTLIENDLAAKADEYSAALEVLKKYH